LSAYDKELQNLHSKQLELQAHLEEYRALRAEQTRRIGNQQNITYLLTLLLAAILSVVTTIPSVPALKASGIKRDLSYILLIVPIFTSGLVFLYLDNDVMILRIGRYITKNLREEINRLASATTNL